MAQASIRAESPSEHLAARVEAAARYFRVGRRRALQELKTLCAASEMTRHASELGWKNSSNMNTSPAHSKIVRGKTVNIKLCWLAPVKQQLLQTAVTVVQRCDVQSRVAVIVADVGISSIV